MPMPTPLLLLTAPMSTAATATVTSSATESWSTADWVMRVVLPLVLAVVGAALYLRGRAAHREATRITSGFGGPPGSLDVGTELGFGVEDGSAARLSAMRTRLWGLVLLAVGLLWLGVALLVSLL
ncbi:MULTISPECIES: hypothetical protein [unclassified Ornithinimicrobium]|uniref:hypothetical protein n=1 Tax=unclassified Ornithinimicrobium TaxID=2615080 RepID=UPI0038545304